MSEGAAGGAAGLPGHARSKGVPGRLVDGLHEYWDETPWLTPRITWLRFAFFALLGLDAWINLVMRASQYGEGGFNAAQFPILDVFPLPTPEIVLGLRAVCGFLALRVALGIAPRASAIGTCVAYGLVYFWSQVDTYQHHYLTFLLLVSFCFVPHQQLGGWDRPEAPPSQVRGWAIRMIYWTIAILYFYAAIAKWDPLWLDGSAVEALFAPRPHVLDALDAAGELLGVGRIQLIRGAAWIALLAELALAAACLWSRLWPLAFVGAPLFHVGIESMALHIEWFSYYMIAFTFIMFMPDPVVTRVDEIGRRLLGGLERRVTPLRRSMTIDGADRRFVLALGVGAALIGGAVIYRELPLPGRGLAALFIGVAIVSAHWPRLGSTMVGPSTRAALQAGMAVAFVVIVYRFDVAYGYYSMWANGLQGRGLYQEAIGRYAEANALKPDGPARFYPIGLCYEALGRPREAVAAFEEALRRASDDPEHRERIEVAIRRARQPTTRY